MLRDPASTGSIAPSSRHLARAMVRASGSPDHIIELGAGTGPVTRALREGLPRASLVAVELQPDLARALRHRFAGLQVRCACAHEVLDATELEGSVALVSSLPFRSLPASVRHTTVSSIAAFLRRHPGSRLVQFTYQPRKPFPAPAGLRWSFKELVLRNVPPAGVWVLKAD